MFPKDTGQINRKSIFVAIYAAIHKLWIAAFLVSTGFDAFQHAPPGTLFEYDYLCALVERVRFFVPFLEDWLHEVCPRCRSPPSDFDFACSTKNRNSEVQYERDQSAGLLSALYRGQVC